MVVNDHNQPKKGDLRVWWIPQIPDSSCFYVKVDSPVQAYQLIDVLAEYDKYQFEHNIKPDYSNAGGLQEFDGKEWYDWESEFWEDLDDFRERVEISEVQICEFYEKWSKDSKAAVSMFWHSEDWTWAIFKIDASDIIPNRYLLIECDSESSEPKERMCMTTKSDFTPEQMIQTFENSRGRKNDN